MKTSLSCLFWVISTFASTFAHADWQADFVINKEDGMHGRPARIYVKGDKIRLDFQPGGKKEGRARMAPSRVIQDASTRRTVILDDAQKTFFETPMTKEGLGAQNFMPCLSGHPEVCFAQQGLKKVSEQTWDGHACEVYEGSNREGTQQIWHAKDLKEVTFVRITKVENGKQTEETHLENIKTGSISADFFAIPAGYTKADPMAEAMKKLPPDQRAKVLEMMKKRGQ